MKEQSQIIKVKFVDFWPDFDMPNFIFYYLLTRTYKVEVSEQPDLLFYSLNGNNHTKYTCTKIFYTGENIRPDFKDCDFAFTFDYSKNNKNYRLPLFALYDDVSKLINRKLDVEKVLKSKSKFCCFVVSNPSSKIRNDFYHNLSKLKHIDSGGRLYKNIDYEIIHKRDFIRDYKFVIAFENTSYPGYTTEKIFEPLLEDCVPIYWGNPLVANDFNTKRFINCHDFSSFEEVMKHILKVDEDDQLYLQYLSEPAFNNDELDPNLKEDRILQKLEEIVSFHQNRGVLTKILQKLRPLYSYPKALYLKKIALKT
ncbi:MAG: glycosyltransferase family 10 domain-containing protein [Bacteroidia bacterium]